MVWFNEDSPEAKAHATVSGSAEDERRPLYLDTQTLAHAAAFEAGKAFDAELAQGGERPSKERAREITSTASRAYMDMIFDGRKLDTTGGLNREGAKRIAQEEINRQLEQECSGKL